MTNPTDNERSAQCNRCGELASERMAAIVHSCGGVFIAFTHTPPERRHVADHDYNSPLRSCRYCGLIFATANEATLIGPCAVRVRDDPITCMCCQRAEQRMGVGGVCLDCWRHSRLPPSTGCPYAILGLKRS